MHEQLDSAVWRTELLNGPAVLTERMTSVGSAAIGFWIRHGTAYEDPAVAGISHLLEHMVFKGTARRSASLLAREIEALGGSLDAYTTHEHTSYQAWVPSQHLNLALDVLVDLVFEPMLRQEDLDLERRVVLEELARAEDTPEDVVFELHASCLYGAHPYGASILGSRDSLRAIEAADLRTLHTRSYVPGNLVVAAAGDIVHDQVVETLLALLPEREAVPRPDLPAPIRESGEFQSVSREGTRQSHIVLGGTAVPYADPLRFAVALVGTALGDGMSSRLFQRIREEMGLAYSVFSYQAFYERGGHIGAYAGTGPETAEAARNALLHELKSLAVSGLPAEEVQATKEQMKGGLLLSLETTAARMNRLAAVALYGEPYASLEGLAGRIDAISDS
ncbi:MAG: pitrilysin family protein, partial [Gemmatimonadota bacterium]